MSDTVTASGTNGQTAMQGDLLQVSGLKMHFPIMKGILQRQVEHPSAFLQ